MNLDRIDLADMRSPVVIANAIHQQLGNVELPVPVAAIARALDILDVRIDQFDGFEGMLLTDNVRSTGTILANGRYGRRRTRFTIAHELGHFLMEWHSLSNANGFSCSVADLRETRAGRRHLRQESQANQFAIGLLAPAHIFDGLLSDDPDLRDAQRVRDKLDISLEAGVRRMIDRHDVPLAAVWSKDNRVRYVHRHKAFPWINRGPGDNIAKSTSAFRAISNGQPGFTEFSETFSVAWTDRADLELHEQTRVGQNGYAVTLLLSRQSDSTDEQGEMAFGTSVPKWG